MAGEARKVAHKWLEKYLGHEISADNEVLNTLAAYAAETREQCAQIAEAPIARLRESMQKAAQKHRVVVVECRQSDIETLERAAAAIRSIAQQDSANEGE